MSGRMELPEALEVLDITHVWDLAENCNGSPCPTRGPVVLKSPFRLDKHGASFSLDGSLKVFKDHAQPEHKGGVWKYVELAKPDWSKAEIARELIRRAGGDPDAKDPNWKAKPRSHYKAEKDEARDRARKRRLQENMRLEPIEEARLRAAPLKIVEHWEAAVERAGQGDFAQRTADERGWPLEWVNSLIMAGLIGETQKGEPCFAVEYDSHLLGVHCRFLTSVGRKAWYYRPNDKHDKRGIAAVPFVLGDPSAPLWIVTEGQWDAVTIYGLLRGFSDHMALDAYVIGLRGSSGADVFMSAYAKQIRAHRPKVMLVPDLDAAAASWTQATGHKWSFMKRLRKIYQLQVWALKFRPVEGREEIKDVNDFYKEMGLKTEHIVNMANALMTTG